MWRKSTGLALALLAGTIFTPDASAWGQTGHRVTGALAEKFLSDEARQAVINLLGIESLAEAATWPDEMRSFESEFWQKTASPWHYVTVPDGQTYSEVGAPEQGNAVTALEKFKATLKDKNASKEDKQLALRFIVHIIGDLHQPLHVGNGTDRGGNDVAVEFYWDKSNLHSVWDSGMIDKEGLSYSEFTGWLGGRITPELAAEWNESDPLVWINESQKLRDATYPQDPKINWKYKFDNMPIVEKRLSQAGVRIAAYLNDVFK